MSKQSWIVFSGGNGRGAYQAGALEALTNKGYSFDSAVGISVGAINAAAVSYDMIPDVLQVWKQVEEKDFISRGNLVALGLRLGWGRLVKRSNNKATGLHDTSKLRRLLDEIFGAFQPVKPLYVGRLDIMSNVYADKVNQGGEVDAIWRSTLIPGIMRADRSGSQLWVDGGVHNITPLARVVQKANDGDDVWIILTKNRRSGLGRVEKSVGKVDAIDIIKASIDHLVDRQFALDLRSFIDRNKIEGYKKFNIHIIEPSSGLGPGDDYSRKTLDRRYDLGKTDAYQYIANNE